MRRIAFFDFDGTITTKDTLLEFIRFYRGNKRFILGFFITSPFIVAYKIGIIKNSLAKQKVLQFFFKGESLQNFSERCKAFSEEVLPDLIRPKALHEIEKLKENGATIVVVSASAENWIQHWCNKLGLIYIGTKLITADGKITGHFDGSNCYGEEKVTRIKNRFDLSDYDEVYSYGDSSGDKQMLELANYRFYKPFR